MIHLLGKTAKTLNTITFCANSEHLHMGNNYSKEEELDVEKHIQTLTACGKP